MTERIGYLVPEFPSQTHTFFWREICALEKAGVEPVLLSTRSPGSRIARHSWSESAAKRTTYLAPASPIELIMAAGPAAFQVFRLATDRIPPGDRKDVLKAVLPLVPFACRLRRISRKLGLTHIHVHSCARSAVLAWLAHRMGGVPYSLTLHGTLRYYGPAQATKWQDAAFATVVTKKLEQEVRDTLAEVNLPPIYIAPMGVDTDYFTREAAYQGPTPGKTLRVFSCGRLSAGKGHADMVRAVSMLANSGLRIRLEIAGEDGSGGTGYRQELERVIEEVDASGLVKLLGSVGEHEVRDKLRSADLFALASHDEAVGVAYMEAMSCGLPVVGTDVGGVSELVLHGKNGLLVEPREPEQIALAIRTLAEHPEMARKLGKAARETVKNGFGSNRSAEVLIEALRTYQQRTVVRKSSRSGHSRRLA